MTAGPPTPKGHRPRCALVAVAALTAQDKTVGALNLYAPVPGFFTVKAPAFLATCRRRGVPVTCLHGSAALPGRGGKPLRLPV